MGNGDRMRMATIKGQSKAVSEGERNEDDDNDFRDFDQAIDLLSTQSKSLANFRVV